MKDYTMVQSLHITDTHLSQPPRQTFITGGILCFSVEPKTQNIYILLGRETCFEQMNSTQGKWCDFGGKINPGESVLGCSAREFAEESLCVIKMTNETTHSYAGYIDRVKQMLRDDKYFLKISIILPPRRAEGVEYVRAYFLKEVPWQPNVETKFMLMRSRLMEDVKNIPFSLRNHPSVCTDKRTGECTVDRHFLEKQAINWWSIDRLSEVIRNRGRFKQHRFRRSFLPVLKIVVATLHDFYS